MCAAIAQIVIKEYSSGARYEGQVNQDGEYQGKGVFSRSDWGRYVGEWWNNCCHGHGKRTFAGGRVKSGKWEKGRFLG